MRKRKWFILLAATLMGALLLACSGKSSLSDDDTDNPQPTQTRVQTTNIVDPRVTKLVEYGRTVGFTTRDQIRAMAYDEGFTREEVDEIIAVIAANPQVKFLRTADGGMNDDPTVSADEPACNATEKLGSPVPEGTTIPAGTCVITEIDHWGTKTSTIFGGVLTEEFTVCDDCTPQTSAWQNYSSLDHVCKDAHRQAEARKSDSTFAGFTFSVTTDCDDGPSKYGNGDSEPTPAATPITVPTRDYTRITGSCKNIPHSDQILAAQIGETLPAGTLVVVRWSNHADLDIYIEWGCLIEDTTFDHIGMHALDGWYGYSKEVKAYANACGEGRARLNGSKISKAWEEGYDIYLLNKDGKFESVPDTCPAK